MLAHFSCTSSKLSKKKSKLCTQFSVALFPQKKQIISSMIMAIEKCKIGIGGPNGRSPLEISRRTEVTLKPFGEDIFVDGMAPCDRLFPLSNPLSSSSSMPNPSKQFFPRIYIENEATDRPKRSPVRHPPGNNSPILLLQSHVSPSNQTNAFYHLPFHLNCFLCSVRRFQRISSPGPVKELSIRVSLITRRPSAHAGQQPSI